MLEIGLLIGLLLACAFVVWLGVVTSIQNDLVRDVNSMREESIKDWRRNRDKVLKIHEYLEVEEIETNKLIKRKK